MGNLDKPIAQIKKGAEQPAPIPGDAIGTRLISWIPIVGEKLKKALDSIRGQDKDARIEFLLTAIVEQLEVHETGIDDILKRLDQPEFTRVLSVTIERIFFGANERKVKRFAAVIANTAIKETTEQGYEDAASFIRTLDELSEDDMKVLKHLYNHQEHLVNEQHAMPSHEFYNNSQMTSMLMDARNLSMQMDDFYARVNRLVGYGLALQIDRGNPTRVDINEYPCRITLLGKRLIRMLVTSGEPMTVTTKP